MKIVLSEKFQNQWDVYLDYCVFNYGKTVAGKKSQSLFTIFRRLSMFPEMGFVEPLLKDCKKVFRAIIFDKKYKIIYTVGKNEITIENFWDIKKNPEKLRKDI